MKLGMIIESFKTTTYRIQTYKWNCKDMKTTFSNNKYRWFCFCWWFYLLLQQNRRESFVIYLIC